MIFLVGIAQLCAKEATRHRLPPDLEKGYIPQEEHRRYVRELDLEHAAKIDQLACEHSAKIEQLAWEHDTAFRQLRDECRKVERERDLSRQEFLCVNDGLDEFGRRVRGRGRQAGKPRGWMVGVPSQLRGSSGASLADKNSSSTR
jgi:hypothetical protein